MKSFLLRIHKYIYYSCLVLLVCHWKENGIIYSWIRGENLTILQRTQDYNPTTKRNCILGFVIFKIISFIILTPSSLNWALFALTIFLNLFYILSYCFWQYIISRRRKNKISIIVIFIFWYRNSSSSIYIMYLCLSF